MLTPVNLVKDRLKEGHLYIVQRLDFSLDAKGNPEWVCRDLALERAPFQETLYTKVEGVLTGLYKLECTSPADAEKVKGVILDGGGDVVQPNRGRALLTTYAFDCDEVAACCHFYSKTMPYDDLTDHDVRLFYGEVCF